MKVWQKTQQGKDIKVGWRTLVSKTFIDPNGEETEYVTKDSMGSRYGAVIALTPENRVVVAVQFRPGPEKIMQELPGGGINSGEDPEKAIMRELLEETGYVSQEVEFIGSEYKDAYTNTKRYFYLAKNCSKQHDQELDDGEFIDTKLISIDQLFENAKNEKMTDASALFFVYDYLNQLKDETA